MTGGFESPGPSYITSRSADVILSDVRPIKLRFDALQSVNVLLDELLYNILSVSHSLCTDKLKAALSKLIPTNLGKEALLEAEIELKAYHERTTPPSASSPNYTQDAEGQFDLQWSFELLRLKCEAYSTMNDSDEDADAEKQLDTRMQSTSGLSPPKSTFVAPAALYLTAILESICEHVLSNVSRVAARDSSRVVATAQDLFIALCEDATFYGTFKAMKVYEQIESLSKAQRPRRSKSFSRSSDKISLPSRTSSPHAELISLRDSSSTPSRLRMSSESFKSNPTTAVPSSELGRTSTEKSRAAKLFMTHSRSFSEKLDPGVSGEVARSQSESGRSRASADFEDDDELLHEFDELMRSGATMKVSLTPDRLKTMEVYHKEKHQRSNRRGPRDTDSSINGSDNPSPDTQYTTERRQPPLRHVDSIIEDEEEPGSRSPPTSYVPGSRARQNSFTPMQSPQVEHPGRMRSISIPNVPHPRHEDGINRKAGTAPKIGPQSTTSQFQNSPIRNGGYNGLSKDMPGQPTKTRRIGKRRESLDLDEIMAGSDEEENEEPPARTSKTSTARSTTSSASPPSSATTAKTPHISRAARDLIAFLDDGPPDEPRFSAPSPSGNASVISFESSKTKSGRLQRMISRLNVGGSTDRTNGRVASEDSAKAPRSLSRKPSGKLSSSTSSPPPSFKHSSLSSKRSLPNVIVAPPPRPPPVIPIDQTLAPSPAPHSTPPLSSASSSQASVNELGSVGLSPRRTVRKAVPAWEEKDGFPMPPTTPLPPIAPTASPVASYQSEFPTPKTPVRRGTNGYARPAALLIAEDDADVQYGQPQPRKPSASPASRHINGHVNGHTNGSVANADVDEERPVSPKIVPPAPAGPRPFVSKPRSPTAPTSSSPEPEKEKADLSTIPVSSIDDLRQLLSVATTADECRLLVDMFFARQGVPYRQPPMSSLISDDTRAKVAAHNDNLENLVVEFLLGGSDSDEVSPQASSANEDVEAVKQPTVPQE